MRLVERLIMSHNTNENIIKNLTLAKYAGADLNGNYIKIHTASYLINDVEADGYYISILQYVISHLKNENISTFLIEHMDVNRKDTLGETPLFYAVSEGNLKLTKTLLEKGANVNSRDILNGSPLSAAISSAQLDVVKFLIDNVALINAANNSLETPLNITIKYVVYPNLNHNDDILRELLARDADLEIADHTGVKSIDIAEKAENQDLIDLLKKYTKN